MTIAETDAQIHDVINKWNVYGAEALCDALARACSHHQYLKDKDYLLSLLSKAIDRVQKGDDQA